MNCILKKCPHGASDNKVSACTTLGECGAAHALERAREINGYEVLRNHNPTVDALKKAGLVSFTPISQSVEIIKATTQVRSVSSKRSAA